MKEQARAEKKRKKLERKQQKAAEAAAKEEPAKEGDGPAPDAVDDGSASGTGT